jgi:hypothetical protein
VTVSYECVVGVIMASTAVVIVVELEAKTGIIETTAALADPALAGSSEAER